MMETLTKPEIWKNNYNMNLKGINQLTILNISILQKIIKKILYKIIIAKKLNRISYPQIKIAIKSTIILISIKINTWMINLAMMLFLKLTMKITN